MGQKITFVKCFSNILKYLVTVLKNVYNIFVIRRSVDVDRKKNFYCGYAESPKGSGNFLLPFAFSIYPCRSTFPI